MHLASASIRVPAAIHLFIEAVPKARADAPREFDGLHGPEWPRGRACRYLADVQRLGHCSVGLTPALAIVAMLLFNDDFDHGEAGVGVEHWRRDRRDTMTDLHRCRVVEAQQLLAKWAFDRLP